MLPKWKLILTNWINCYFNCTNPKELPVNLESLIDIITHLRENLNLDETKSSLLDAHTVQEFVAEKFPDFKFKNGTNEPEGEEDVYLVASLLLFFVCVNSKNVDMKSAMCSKLSPADQEIILKFSKHLMECSRINVVDIQTAITEACEQEVAAPRPTSMPVSVAETPPAMRSLHSEVRRLQAALDAERFDRTYLQEELTRTNMKVEKLLKDKEQYKLEIVNLKSQISLCCGQERESQGENVECSNISKLMKQLEQMEERLLIAQEQLEDVQEERETYKAKLTQLKLEHEKLLALSHQESARASGLAEELEAERRHTQSLRELVSELRQHNQLNKMDSSLLECDDPNASYYSLPHNSSSCSEVCANVIEVQLGEERAKIVALKQQMQMLQDQLAEMTKQTEEQKESLSQIISQKENTIMTLKHKVNEEVEEKITVKKQFDEEVAKLNNDLVELEQRLKVSQENSQDIIANKMKKIQNLQEEKLSLLQCLSDETSKSENIIKHLRDEIDAEKTSKIKQRDEYDSIIMKLNDKILNRNNELVELQNKILEKGKIIDTLLFELRAEKFVTEELLNKHNEELTHLNSIREQLERECQEKAVECNNMGETIRQLEERLQIAQEQLVNVQEERETIEAKLRQLKSEHEELLAFSHQESARARGLVEELEVERLNIVALRQEIQMLQNQISENTTKTEKELEDLRLEREKLKQIISEKESSIMTLKHRLDEEIQEKNNVRKQSDAEVAKLKDEIIELEQRLKGTQENSRHIIENNMKEIQNLQEEKLSLLQSLSDETNKSENIIKQLKDEIDAEKAVKTMQRDEYDSQIMKLNEKMLNRNNELVELQNKILENEKIIDKLQFERRADKFVTEELLNKHNEELTLLNSVREQLERECQEKAVESYNMGETMRQLEERLQTAQEQLVDVQGERETVEAKLSQVKLEHDKLLALSHQESARASGLAEELQAEKMNIVEFKQQIQRLQDQISEITRKTEEKKEEQRIEEEKLKEVISENKNTIATLEHRLNEEIQEKINVKKQFDDEVLKLKNEIIETEKKLKDTQENSRSIIENKMKEIKNIQEEKLSLLQSLSEDTNKSENIIKHLTDQIDSEKSSKIKQIDEYDSQIMKLNEKMLNRNNELVELQNKILEKGEIIETLQLQLRREKELREELSNKHNEELTHLNSVREQLERECQEKAVQCTNMGEIMRQLEERLQTAQEERETYKTKLSQLKLEQEELLALSKQESTRAIGLAEELEAERVNIVALRQEIQNFQDRITESARKTEEEKEKQRMEEEKLNEIISEKENTIVTLKHRLNEEIHGKNILQKQFDDEVAKVIEIEQRLKDTHKNTQNIIENKLKEIQNLQEEKLFLLQNLSEDTNKSEDIIKHLTDQIDSEKSSKIKQRDEYDSQIMKLNEKMLNRNNELVELQNKILEKSEIIETLQLELRREKELREELSNKHNEELSHLNYVREELERECQEKDVECNNIGETMKQLEERLQTAQEERETYKTKLSQLKLEQEELLALSKQESTRAIGLAEELEAEKVNIVALRQEIQNLQDRITDSTRKTEEEKEKQKMEEKKLDEIIFEKENIIVTLKHRLNQEIHEKNTVKKQFDDEVAKLKDEITELEQRLRGTQENSRNIIENKMKEIQNLQEEKLSLLQSLSDESNKLENIIKQLKVEIDAEKTSKIRQRDEYDSQMMKLNEKMLNRNNELVELQNKIFEKGEIIETLQLQLRREKELREELSNRHNEELIHLNSVREQLERECKEKAVECNNMGETMRQLEERLHTAQEQLVDVQAERETVEAKLSQLKSEHEKLLALSHQESTRASDLAEELEAERRHTQSLRELVSELRQHNQLNRMDSSLVECDNPEASATEVQLEEERAQVLALKQQIQSLQDQLDDVTRKTEEEKEKHGTEKDKLENNIMALKHRVNEEIEEKNTLKRKFDDEVAKLNNDRIELENRLKGTQENSRNIIDSKRKEIKQLQDEQSALLQSLSDETSKSENVTKHLRDEIDAEKSSKIRQRDEYDSQMMKLNEKMLNRNNELVELQNKILEKGEIIETLQLELRREKELREELSNKHNEELIHLNSVREQLEQNLQRKSEEAEDLHKHLQQHIALIEQINEDNECLKANIVQLQEDCKMFKDSEEKLLAELKDRDVKAEQIYKETENLRKLLYEEKQKQLKIEESNAINAQQNENQPSNAHTGQQMISNAVVPLLMQTCMDAANQEKSSYKSAAQGTDVREHQVDTTPTDHTPTSFECCKTISDLEKILQDRNRTIRALQSDIIDLKSLVAESENKLLDVSNDLELSKENCQQLSNQLKKIVHQKNEEIADLKKQLTKMSMTENRASQIIKVSAKYQAIILKRIAEIKSNTVLKELTNFGNTTNSDNDLRRGLNSKTITMEDLENFLDTTDRHLKRFSEKQIALQKERDRLAEVNKINESEIINMRKFLTELSVSIKTFNSVKDLYAQKLTRVVSLQRTVRREILGLDGQITDATMCKLERGYAAVMQDLSECTMNLERWVERTIGRVISVEKIKQAFSSEERISVAPTTVQNASLEVQLEELENSFCKLLEEVARAQKGEAAKVTQAATVMEVRAEYEDKLNRMKAKMKELYQEQIGIFKERQREEIVSLEQELQRARDKLEESSRAYEEHIRSLTTELWNVGEKFLMKKDEAEWLRRKQRSGSLMSLQHMHSSGLVPTQEEPSRPSDTHSLRSLPVATNANGKSEGRTLHMSDEEGEVFDNRCLRELASTPGGARGGRRLSELQWRNSLCPPHLKSSYPAETQFVPAIHEEDIKCVGPTMSLGGRSQRKEVGITAYKKPGPPTPSKQAGRLSATDSELRESLRVDTEPNASRKTSTPSRIRALFRSGKGDNEGTPRSRRLSNIFRKK